MVKLLVGLGNPGSRYASTRHNIGFIVLEEVARRLGASWSLDRRARAEVAEVRRPDGKLLLMRPQTYMNSSGEAVAPFARFHRIDPLEILVVHDDLDLPFGRLRFRTGGSGGGQNGVADVIRHLGSDRFHRLKVGVSRPPAGWTVINWVLTSFTPDEQPLLPDVVRASADAVLAALDEGVSRAQNRFNGLDLRPAPPKPTSAEVDGQKGSTPELDTAQAKTQQSP
ncbi:MAG TPA: aminoacyl-tRNA hydrolase [Deinococcales bacterium]|nr:aminoacyl-tRNA hydrolase [Deinococcales bacterium]